ATQIAFDVTQTAFIMQIEEQHQQTVQAEQVFQAQTQSALDLAATATAEAFVPTAEPVLIPTMPQAAVPTAASLVTGRFQSQTPADGTSFIMGEAFTVTWVIENTSSMNWGEDFKLVFDGGTNFSTGTVTERYTNTIIYPNGAAGLSIPCTAPWAEGTYTMQWHVEDNNGNVVFPNLTITIKSVYGVLTPTPGPTEEYSAGPIETPGIYEPPVQP
ncbi:MAG: hypothetical protein IKP86_04885, partial [Anaerolineaceae bacterium]|nr:hypothetical protein [Anaerolineaceae bacterium]